MSPAADERRRPRARDRSSEIAATAADGAAGRRTRDAARTRVAILDAAEQLFTARGFRGTTLQEVGAAAGLSRGTPSYFFGSKSGLYTAVVDRTLRRLETFFAERGSGGTARSSDAALSDVVSRYVDFLAGEPTFVRLMQAETLDGSDRATARTLEMVRAQLEQAGVARDASARLGLALVALCWFPLANERTVARILGLDPRVRSELETHKRYISGLLVRRAAAAAAPLRTADPFSP